ncbi:MAG: hypothetical protein PHD58_00810 [Anaerolineales bacterium]|nr:hypothetical protein [Anaerolineales bacterium]
MKRAFVFILLSVFLTACAGAGSDRGRCMKSEDGEVCVRVRAEEPIRFGEPVTIVITVTSEREIADLRISLFTSPTNTMVEEPEKWETGTRNQAIWKGGAGWDVTIKSGQPLAFSRELHLPLEEGEFDVIVHASTPHLRVVDSLSIYQTSEGSKVYLSGTSIPINEGPLPTENSSQRATRLAYPTEPFSIIQTPYVEMLSPAPTTTITPTQPSYPPPVTQIPRVAYPTVTPTQPPYP